MTWGIVPAAGVGSRMQPLAFSKELLPVGSRLDHGVERPRAVGEYLIDRMIRGGATKVCLVIAPSKGDIVAYFGGAYRTARLAYVVQQEPAGLCDAIFQARDLIADDEPVIVGLPDTIWYPEDALAHLPNDRLSFLCFPVDDPRAFDAVVSDERGRISRIDVKDPNATSHWVWGAFKLPGRVLHELAALWAEAGRRDVFIGTLINAWLARGGEAWAVHAGQAYVDVGTLHGWRDAVHLLERQRPSTLPLSLPAVRRHA